MTRLILVSIRKFDVPISDMWIVEQIRLCSWSWLERTYIPLVSRDGNCYILFHHKYDTCLWPQFLLTVLQPQKISNRSSIRTKDDFLSLLMKFLWSELLYQKEMYEAMHTNGWRLESFSFTITSTSASTRRFFLCSFCKWIPRISFL